MCVFALLYVHTRFMVSKRLFFSAKAAPVLLRSLVVVLPQQFGRFGLCLTFGHLTPSENGPSVGGGPGPSGLLWPSCLQLIQV